MNTASAISAHRPGARLRFAAAAAAVAVAAAACGGSDDASSSDASSSDASSSDGESGAAATCEPGQTDGDLAVFNWSEYIAPEQLEAFSAQFGVDVSEDTFESNEAMQAIVSQGGSGFDLIVPSDYMVNIMRESGDLLRLDRDAIPNLSNIGEEYLGFYFDPDNEFSVPYQVGTTGLGVDTAVVGTDFPRSWGLVFDPAIADQFSGQITLLNDPRETLGAALLYLGYDINTTDEAELGEARDLIASARDRLAAFDTDSANDLLVDGETAIAHSYSGDLFGNFAETDDPSRYVYFVPEEGGVRWLDNMAIPADAGSPCTAHTFIDWLLDGEQGATLTNFTYYETPNTAAVDGLDEDLQAFLTDESVLAGGPDSLSTIVDTGEFEINYSDAFIEAKG
ncbi:MAG: spermidine/putrescine ABC transporter substrate-binding protein [Actinomycetota bacterium]